MDIWTLLIACLDTYVVYSAVEAKQQGLHYNGALRVRVLFRNVLILKL